MAVIADQQTFEKTKSKFDYVISPSNRGRLTEEVVRRLVKHDSLEIFNSGFLEKVARGVANVLVVTAYNEIELGKKTGKPYDSIELKKQFYLNSQIKEICNMNGFTFGKQMVYALDSMFEKFQGNQERILEVLRYIKVRREEDGVEHDLYSMFRISNEVAPQIMHLASPSGRRLIVQEILSENKNLEQDLQERQYDEELELEELIKADPEYVYANLFKD